MNRREERSFGKSILVFALAVGALLLPIRAWGGNPNDQLCFPKVTWFGSLSGPSIDGDISADNGWRGAFRYVFGNGSNTPDVIVQGIRDDSTSPPSLFISVQSNNLDGLTTGQQTGLPGDPYTKTLVVLGFDPGDGDPTHIQLIHIYPILFQTNNAMASTYQGGVRQVNYWPNGQWTTVAPTLNPGWLFGSGSQVSYHQNGSSYQWQLEMKLPITNDPNKGLRMPTASSVPPTYGLYISVLRVFNDPVAGFTYHQRSWPPDLPEDCPDPFTCSSPQAGTPIPVTQWGVSPIVSDSTQACGGVSIGSQNEDISTNNNPTSAICFATGLRSDGTVCGSPTKPTPNVFTALVHNTMRDGTGLPQTANNVHVSFFISPWGINNDWTPIPFPTLSTPLPDPPTQDIPSAALPAGLEFSTPTAWFPVPVPFALGDHKCIMVKLDSPGASGGAGSNTVFLNNTAIRNMDFVGASKFKRSAEISAKGYPFRPKKHDGTLETDQMFDLRVVTRQAVLTSAKSLYASKQAGAPGSRGKQKGRSVTSELTWVLEACRHTGHYIINEGTKFELCDDVGSFGYVVHHEGFAAVDKWKVQFSGQGVEKVPGTDKLYHLRLPKDSTATVTTTIEPQEQKWAAFLDLGGAFPHGTFSSAFDPGFNLNAGLEYMATSHFSAEGIFGYHHFPGKIGGDLNVYQFSANAKVYLVPPQKFRPFLNGGVGAYKFSPGTGNFGGNFGGGVLYELTPRFGLQGSYNFHAVNTTGGATKFSAIQGGIRYVF